MTSSIRLSQQVKGIIGLVIIAVIFNWGAPRVAAQKTNLKNVKILVYTKNGKGYVHDNIPYAVKCIQKLGVENGFKVDVSDTPTVFTENNLKQYTLLLFPSTNYDVSTVDGFLLKAHRRISRICISSGGVKFFNLSRDKCYSLEDMPNICWIFIVLFVMTERRYPDISAIELMMPDSGIQFGKRC